VTLRVSFRFDGLGVVNVAQRGFHLLISALNITMSQRKSVLYVSNITSMVTMLQDRLTSLAVLHVHRDIDIRSFTLGKSRHIDFGYGH
jgi:ribonucleotide monophosphatase NagD (HAD superfamily)